MNNAWWISWILLLLFISEGRTVSTPVHPIHVSKFTLRYSVQDTGYRTTLYLFTDDLKRALRQLPDAPDSEIDLSMADSLIRLYIQMHIQVTSDGVHIDPLWIGKELSSNEHAYWIYQFYPAKKNWTTSSNQYDFYRCYRGAKKHRPVL